MTEPRKRGEEPFNARHNFGYKKFTPETAHVDYECPLCLTKPVIIMKAPTENIQATISIKCKCFGKTTAFDDTRVDAQDMINAIASELKTDTFFKIGRAGAPPKGVSLKDWVVGIANYFGGRGQLAPRTSELSEGEKMFMWREIRG